MPTKAWPWAAAGCILPAMTPTLQTLMNPSLLPFPADSDDPLAGCAGYCRHCRREHRLGPGDSRAAALRLMELLHREGTVDLFREQPRRDPALATEVLFGPARGKMFGVLQCRSAEGEIRHLYAFSGQYEGRWLVPGWVPPVFDPEDFARVHDPLERRIKEMGRALDNPATSAEQCLHLRRQRRLLSRRLMLDLHGLYRLPNPRGEELPMAEAYLGAGNMPTGTGDCCAPKLLAAACRLGLRPLGLSEFYWGRENRSGTRHHGRFSPPCEEKCLPILGFMLCGLDEEGR